MKCPSCGVNNDSDARHCKSCGRALPAGNGGNNRNSALKGIIIAVIVLCVLLIGVAAFFIVRLMMNQSGQTDTVEETTASQTEEVTEENGGPTEPTTAPVLSSPNIVGLKAEDAYSALTTAGLVYETSFDYSDSVQQNYVIKQTPEAGTKMKKGDVVNVCISLGKHSPPPQSSVVSSSSNSSSSSSSASSSSSSGYTSYQNTDYILPNSNKAYVTRSEIDWMDKNTMELALNEIYARLGCIYKNGWIAEYFNSKSWYHGTKKQSEFTDADFNKYEKANIDFIVSVMKEKGYRK